MTGDDKAFTSLHVVEQLRQMSFGFGRLLGTAANHDDVIDVVDDLETGFAINSR
jgi:hypothetical protein